MEIKSEKKERAIMQEWVEVLITPKDADRVVEVLGKIKEKGKLDRYEEMIIGDLIVALQEPSIKVPEEKPSGDGEPRGTVIPHPTPNDFQKVPDTPHDGITVGKKIEIINQVKARIDRQGLKDVKTFIQDSITALQKDFGVKTLPKSNSVEAFYDWMVAEKVIFPDGTPDPSFIKRT